MTEVTQENRNPRKARSIWKNCCKVMRGSTGSGLGLKSLPLPTTVSSSSELWDGWGCSSFQSKCSQLTRNQFRNSGRGLLRIFETAHSGNIHLIKKKISPVSSNEQQGPRSTLMKSVIFFLYFSGFLLIKWWQLCLDLSITENPSEYNSQISVKWNPFFLFSTPYVIVKVKSDLLKLSNQ